MIEVGAHLSNPPPYPRLRPPTFPALPLTLTAFRLPFCRGAAETDPDSTPASATVEGPLQPQQHSCLQGRLHGLVVGPPPLPALPARALVPPFSPLLMPCWHYVWVAHARQGSSPPIWPSSRVYLSHPEVSLRQYWSRGAFCCVSCLSPSVAAGAAASPTSHLESPSASSHLSRTHDRSRHVRVASHARSSRARRGPCAPLHSLPHEPSSLSPSAHAPFDSSPLEVPALSALALHRRRKTNCLAGPRRAPGWYTPGDKLCRNRRTEL